MPSFVVTNVSGGTNLLSGMWPSFSGTKPTPYSQIFIKADSANSGNLYIGLSGGVTIRSGGVSAGNPNNSGLLDGYQLAPGVEYKIPRLGFAVSGLPQVFAACDAVASGFARAFVEVY